MINIEILKEVLLKKFDIGFKRGLCIYFTDLCLYGYITEEEYLFLIKKIEEHENYKAGDYIWKKGDKQPRIEWIKNLK